MSKKEDLTGYNINLGILEILSEKSEYWENSYNFVMDMQEKESFTEKQSLWLENIAQDYMEAYLKFDR